MLSITAKALWYTGVRQAEIRNEAIARPDCGEKALVRTRASAISRGTERLVFNGKVPAGEWARMKAPFQGGDFPFPVKYGYANVGVVDAGPEPLVGVRVFCLYPHQSAFVVSSDSLVPIPDGVSDDRAVLAANMETALNALWDGNPSPGDHICVVGGGLVGLLTAYLCCQIPGTRVTLVDVNPARRGIADRLGAQFALPGDVPGNQDLVFHASATADGLATALQVAGNDTGIVELSWYGDASVPVQLGAEFHSRRLRLISSQVGTIRPDRQSRWTFRRRIETAMSLLNAKSLDCLITHHIDFTELPARLSGLFDPAADVIAAVVNYSDVTDNTLG
ncbi:zinc-binding alcohol dehydrogenase [Roseibium sp. RKSG952]|nr:zinc-binding alcohol dehydrogenase [Roseibium sp. RKSG952]